MVCCKVFPKNAFSSLEDSALKAVGFGSLGAGKAFMGANKGILLWLHPPGSHPALATPAPRGRHRMLTRPAQ